MIIKNREKRFIAEFFLEKKGLFFFSRNWKFFFAVVTRAAFRAVEDINQFTFFFRKMSIVSHLMTFSEVQGDSYGKVTYFQNIPNKIKLCYYFTRKVRKYYRNDLLELLHHM